MDNGIIIVIINNNNGEPASQSVVCSCADSYVEVSAREAGAAAELVATRQIPKYSDLSDQCTFYWSQWRR